MRIASWQRNLYVLTVAEMVAVSGLFLITPFLPYYIQALGVTDPAEVKTWSGWMISAQALAIHANNGMFIYCGKGYIQSQ